MSQQQATALSTDNQVSSNESSPSSSISLVKVDELSAFGATKRSRLPALIKLQESAMSEEIQQVATAQNQPASMPILSGQQFEQTKATTDERQTSLPAHVEMDSKETGGKENLEESGDFQVVDMISADLMGPSLPQPQLADKVLGSSRQVNQQQSSMLGGSLIDMIVNLRNENQNLVRALETNNEYVKDRLSEFKRIQEESKRREAQFAMEKAEHEHQVRKLQRQNLVLSERLKSMEVKLKDFKLEVSESLAAAHSSRASSQQDPLEQQDGLYPNLDSNDLQNLNTLTNKVTFDQHNAPTMHMDATNDEINTSGPSAPMESVETTASRVGAMSKDELSKRFDADKAAFYAMEDPLQQCDQLEKQLNEIGKRDYEICLLQQQLNIYRQDYRMEKMANLEAKIQIEKLKNDIDRLCLERLMERNKMNDAEAAGHKKPSGPATAGLRLAAPAAAAADAVISRLGHQLSRKAARSAAKAARYASKQAHLEEKAAAAAARAAAAAANAPAGQHERRHSHHGRHGRPSSGIKSEVVNDLLSTANKAMLTGYKMASTHVNLAIDKLSQFEQAQASHLEKNKQQQQQSKSMEPPSVD